MCACALQACACVFICACGFVCVHVCHPMQVLTRVLMFPTWLLSKHLSSVHLSHVCMCMRVCICVPMQVLTRVLMFPTWLLSKHLSSVQLAGLEAAVELWISLTESLQTQWLMYSGVYGAKILEEVRYVTLSYVTCVVLHAPIRQWLKCTAPEQRVCFFVCVW